MGRKDAVDVIFQYSQAMKEYQWFITLQELRFSCCQGSERNYKLCNISESVNPLHECWFIMSGKEFKLRNLRENISFLHEVIYNEWKKIKLHNLSEKNHTFEYMLISNEQKKD